MKSEPAIFIRKETADVIASGLLGRISDLVAYAVRPHKRRGEMQGYTVSLRYRCGNIHTLTEQTVEQIGA
ncbi:MAG: hypothetical protein AAGA71_12855 [Pseudomonadota bacterium]